MGKQLKPPVAPLKEAHERAMEMIESSRVRVAVFIVGGAVKCAKSSSPTFDARVKRLASGLVGVYDLGADSRQVYADLGVFYEGMRHDLH